MILTPGGLWALGPGQREAANPSRPRLLGRGAWQSQRQGFLTHTRVQRKLQRTQFAGCTDVKPMGLGCSHFLSNTGEPPWGCWPSQLTLLFTPCHKQASTDIPSLLVCLSHARPAPAKALIPGPLCLAYHGPWGFSLNHLSPTSLPTFALAHEIAH